MDIAVIGSNMVDLITYTNQMPKEGKPLRRRRSKLAAAGKGPTRPLPPLLNSKVLMLTKVGDDIFADNTIRNLESQASIPLMLRKSLVPAAAWRRSCECQLQQQHSYY